MAKKNTYYLLQHMLLQFIYFKNPYIFIVLFNRTRLLKNDGVDYGGQIERICNDPIEKAVQ